ncbi:Cytochrome P450 89A9 [Dichanthelium oligosanthes]|uniref:Cytochrome P450 89A9 n=1 Tax=Dichanthelium oligosanthes TaxID=888268 RepID=A0A1E5W0L4_9POAL|nr:Cytochrome P450 89A9 [Dichanthelium oligosanthes]
MEAMQLLITAGLAVLAVLAVYRRRRSRHALHTAQTMPTILVADADAARRLIIGHADSFSNHPAVLLPVDIDAGHPRTQSITIAPYGPLWRALRGNLTANIVHPSRLSHLATIQRRAVEALVADLSAAGRGAAGEEEVVVRDGVYAAVFTTVVRLCFGDDDGVGGYDARAIQSALREFFHSGVDATLLGRSRLARLVHWRQWRYLVGTRHRLAELFGPVIAARRRSRRSNGEDTGGISSYLDSLLDLRIPNNDDADLAGTRRELRDDEVVRLVWEFLGSSTEAVVACVEWTLARLVTEPEVQKKLHHELVTASDHRKGRVSEDRLQDIPYLRAVILESLRLHPPLPLIVREVRPEGVAAAGATPPPDGTPVRFLFNAEEIARDQKVWTDPDEFRPERFLAGGEGEDVSPVPGPNKGIKMMPFGAGRRHCPGVGLSMIHVGCFVALLVREFDWAPPADGSGVDLTAINTLVVKMMASPLRARITPRTRMSQP